MNKNVLIYNYDYSVLGIDLEGEFFISSTLTLQSYIKPKSKRDFLIMYRDKYMYSHNQVDNLIKRYSTLIHWDNDLKKFQMENEKWVLRKSLIETVGSTYLSVPLWLFDVVNVFHLNFTQLYILSLTLSYFHSRKVFNWSNEIIARKLEMTSTHTIIKNIHGLQDLGLIEITRTNKTNILSVTDKFLFYENKSN